jgi:hypothetical protein
LFGVAYLRAAPVVGQRALRRPAAARERLMANSTQGLATLMFLMAFTFLGVALLKDGSVLFGLLSLVSLGASCGLFLKAKALTAKS